MTVILKPSDNFNLYARTRVTCKVTLTHSGLLIFNFLFFFYTREPFIRAICVSFLLDDLINGRNIVEKVRFHLTEVFVLNKLNKHSQRFINYLLSVTENEIYKVFLKSANNFRR